MNNFYRITMKADKQAEILIYDFIGQDWFGDGVAAKAFAEELRDLGPLDTIELRINSPGGSVWDGNAIYNTLRANRATVNVTVDGLAASIASVIAMAGDTITMPDNALMMIHNPMALAMGESDDMRTAADMLDKIKIGAISAYHGKSGMDTEELAKMMDAETWITAQEAVDMGFADEIGGSIAATNNAAISKFDFSKFNNVPGMGPGMIKNTPSIGDNPKGDSMNLAEMKDKHPELYQKVLALGTDKGKEGKEAAVIAARNEGREGEAQRIQDVHAQVLPGHEELIATLAADGNTTGPEAAQAVLQAERVKLKAIATGIDDNASPSLPGEASDNADDNLNDGVDKNAPLAEQCKAKWDKTPSLRDEFDDDYDGYLAFMKADEKGRIKVLGK